MHILFWYCCLFDVWELNDDDDDDDDDEIAHESIPSQSITELISYICAYSVS